MVVFAIPIMALASGAWAEAALYAGGTFIASLILGENVARAVAGHQTDPDATDATNLTPPDATDGVNPRAPSTTDSINRRAPNATDDSPRRPRPRR